MAYHEIRKINSSDFLVSSLPFALMADSMPSHSYHKSSDFLVFWLTIWKWRFSFGSSQKSNLIDFPIFNFPCRTLRRNSFYLLELENAWIFWSPHYTYLLYRIHYYFDVSFLWIFIFLNSNFNFVVD